MKQTFSIQEKAGQFACILFPILITQLSLASAVFVDTVMSGRVSSVDLAGVAIGVNIWQPLFNGLNGVIIGITPILAQLHGAGKKSDIPFVVVQGLYFAAALSVIVIAAGGLLLTPLLTLVNFDPLVYRIGHDFLAAIALGIFPLFIASLLRSFLDSLGYTRVTMLIILCALPINILLNYLLIFGNFGFPRLGGAGAGYASAITYWCIALIFIIVVHKAEPFKSYHIFRRFYRISFPAWKEQLNIGLPIGLAIFCEMSIFGVVALLMANFGTMTIAAHQAAINFVSLIYMVPLSIGIALTICVGFEVGAGRHEAARQYSYLGLGMAIAVSLAFAAVLSVYKNEIAGLYSADRQMLTLIGNFLGYAIFFQLSDAIAAPIQGALRGYKDVTAAFLIAVVSYWGIGLPAGYLLAEYSSCGAYGYWIGFIAGLAAGAAALAIRLALIQKKRTVAA